MQRQDRRTQKTHKALAEALVSLIADKPYDSIVIKEILDRANVGRSTFYTHFRDKDDLLLKCMHEMLGPNPVAGYAREIRRPDIVVQPSCV